MSKVDRTVLDSIKDEGAIVKLNNGFRVRVRQLPMAVFDAVVEKFPMPDPPEVEIGEKGRTEPNPNDPDYLKACREIENKRGEAILTAIYILCVELIDPIPEDHIWLTPLQNLYRITGLPDLSQLNLSDPIERKLAFLKYCAVGRSHLNEITQYAHLTEEAIRQAEASFRGDEERRPDKDGSS